MLFIPENREDISKYYRHSFLKFKEHGDTIFYISYVDENVVSGSLEDGREFKLYLAKEEPYEVDYVLPHKSFFQYGDDAVMLERIPAKQYHRGLTPSNTAMSFRDPNGDVKHLDISFETLKAFVSKQKFYTLSEAMKQVALNSVVLTSRMMYVPSKHTIFIDFIPIAMVASNTKTIRMIAPLFKEEVQEFLKSTHESEMFTFKEAK